jgi:hypothetical protein
VNTPTTTLAGAIALLVLQAGLVLPIGDGPERAADAPTPLADAAIVDAADPADGTLAMTGVWADHGFALPGANGTPHLVGRGELLGDTQIVLHMESAPPFESAILVIGESFAPQPYKGGTLVPSPDIVIYGLYVDAGGALSVAGRWPSGIPSGYQLFFQYWIPDATGGHDVYTASNTISGTAP